MSSQCGLRKQPQRACKQPHKDPPPWIVAKKETKTNSQQLVDIRVWENLGDDMVDAILSHLPVYTLWRTVINVQPTRWAQIFCNFNVNNSVLAHGKHINSSIGFIKIYIDYSKAFQLPKLIALEHETNIWQPLPSYPAPKIHKGLLQIVGVSDGLLCLVRPSYDAKNRTYEAFARPYLKYKRQIGVWNPVSSSHRWLPPRPLDYDSKDGIHLQCLQALVVDADQMGYKGVEMVWNWEKKNRHLGYMPSMVTICGVFVYDSVSSSWSTMRALSKGLRIEVFYNGGAPRVISCEGSLCFVTFTEVDAYFGRLFRKIYLIKGLACYNPTTDKWHEVLINIWNNSVFKPLVNVFDSFCFSQDKTLLLYAAGKVYLVFEDSRRMLGFYVVSIEMDNLRCGIEKFEYVTQVKLRNLLGPPHPSDVMHSWLSFTNGRKDLVLTQHMSEAYQHEWYMLHVDGKVYLCVVLCDKWQKRFDLEAGQWMMTNVGELPSETEAVEKDTNIEVEYLAYIPSWIRV